MTKLPDFKPVSLAELRDLWAKHPDPDIRRLVLEVARYRESMAAIEGHHRNIHEAWKHYAGGKLVALHEFQKLLNEERERLTG